MRKLFSVLIIASVFILSGCKDKKDFSGSAVFAAATVTETPLVLPDTPAPEPIVPEPITVEERSALPEGFAYTSDVVPDVILEIRYYSAYNFVGERVDGYRAPLSILTEEAADALAYAASLFREQGYVIKIYDTYRPADAVAHFVRWGQDLEDTRMKAYFYPDLEKADLFDGYISTRSGHSRGSTVDLTLVNMFTGMEADMGGPFDFFGDVSNYAASGINETQNANRVLLRTVMEAAGFRPYNKEWWHFTLNNEPYPDTYFNFPVE
ncbi:MAG: M15 family metallopeptidase [Clostridiales bacterium]|jgi:D-alanyl-D-alanine dipeptidase|nr:M15 family metallopeptidase [Clostridiales bacterium]